MREKIISVKSKGMDFIKHPLFTGSAIMIFGTNIANFLAYLYHLILGRMLGPASYSELAATLAALGLFSTAFVFVGMVVVKFVASTPDKEKGILYKWLMRKSLKFGIIGVIILFIFSPLISNFMHLPLKTAFLLGPILFFFLFSFLFRSFLQGLLKFASSVSLTFIDIASRLVFGIIFVYFGLRAFGGVLGIFLGAFLSFLIGYFLLRELRNDTLRKKFNQGKEVLTYAYPIIIASVANNSFISSDVILTKHYFDAHTAGIYASLSTLGKIIFYGTAPVASVMFPLISKKYSEGKNYKSILVLSLILTACISSAVLGIYLFFPELMVKILFGNKFLEGATDLFWFGLFMVFYTLANVLVSFYLSINKTKIVTFPVIFAIFQIAGILLYHSSILSVVRVSVLSSALLLAALLIYFTYERKNKNKSF